MAIECSRASGIDLCDVLPGATLAGARRLSISSCTADSGLCRPGDLFVLLPGSRESSVRQAASRGAKAVLCQQLPADCPLPACVTPDVRQAYGEVCQALVGHPSRRVKVVGIAGASGDHAAGLLTARTLEAAGFPTAILSGLGSFDGVRRQAASEELFAAPAVAAWLAASEANGCTHAVMELPAAAGEDCLSGIELDAACVARAALGTHRWLDALHAEGVAVFNRDDAAADALADDYPGVGLTVGLSRRAEITATLVERCASEQTFLLHVGDETVPLRIRRVGNDHLRSCLLAAAVGFVYGVEPAVMARGMESIRWQAQQTATPRRDAFRIVHPAGAHAI